MRREKWPRATSISKGFENVSFIIDTTPLPIQHQQGDVSSVENGVWDEAHKTWGAYFSGTISSE